MDFEVATESMARIDYFVQENMDRLTEDDKDMLNRIKTLLS